MEENTPLKPSNPVLEFIKGNQKLVFLTGGVTLLFIIIVSIIVSMNTTANPAAKKPTPTPRQNAQTPTVIPTKAPLPTKTLTIQENNRVLRDVDPQLDERIDVTYSVSSVKGYGDEWAMFEVRNPSTDPAKVIAKKEKGVWVVKLGPGTSFEENELRQIGAPQNLINEVNDAL